MAAAPRRFRRRTTPRPRPCSTAPANPAVVASVPASTGACTKGWLWPFVRDGGDFLTDTEKSEASPATYGGGPAPVSQATAASLERQHGVSWNCRWRACPRRAPATKGWLWPFVRRDKGDCPTDTEKEGRPCRHLCGAPRRFSGELRRAADGQQLLPAAPQRWRACPAVTGACSKGWLWPFVRDNGDCLTATEKQEGHAGVYGNPDAARGCGAARREWPRLRRSRFRPRCRRSRRRRRMQQRLVLALRAQRRRLPHRDRKAGRP